MMVVVILGQTFMPILQMGEPSLQFSRVAFLVSGRVGMKTSVYIQIRNPYLGFYRSESAYYTVVGWKTICPNYNGSSAQVGSVFFPQSEAGEQCNEIM